MTRAAPAPEVFFLPGSTFRTGSTWRESTEDDEVEVTLLHQLDSVRGADQPPIVDPARVPALVRLLLEKARAEPPLRLREEGRFSGPLT